MWPPATAIPSGVKGVAIVMNPGRTPEPSRLARPIESAPAAVADAREPTSAIATAQHTCTQAAITRHRRTVPQTNGCQSHAIFDHRQHHVPADSPQARSHTERSVERHTPLDDLFGSETPEGTRDRSRPPHDAHQAHRPATPDPLPDRGGVRRSLVGTRDPGAGPQLTQLVGTRDRPALSSLSPPPPLRLAAGARALR